MCAVNFISQNNLKIIEFGVTFPQMENLIKGLVLNTGGNHVMS